MCAFAFVGALLVTGWAAEAQTPADNTKVNQRDRSKDAATADQQKKTPAIAT